MPAVYLQVLHVESSLYSSMIPSQLETVRGEIAEIEAKILKNEKALAAAQEPADIGFLRQRLGHLDKKEILLLKYENLFLVQVP